MDDKSAVGLIDVDSRSSRAVCGKETLFCKFVHYPVKPLLKLIQVIKREFLEFVYFMLSQLGRLQIDQLVIGQEAVS